MWEQSDRKKRKERTKVGDHLNQHTALGRATGQSDECKRMILTTKYYTPRKVHRPE